MKRFFVAVLFVVLAATSAHSELIRDVKLGQPYTFEEDAEITFTDFSFVKKIATTDGTISCQDNEEIALFNAEITNLRTTPCTFGSDVALSVVTIYKGKYSYNGTAGQYKYNGTNVIRNYRNYYRNGYYEGGYYAYAYEQIGMMYSRNFAFFCTLPKRVVNDEKSSLQMIIKIGDHELTYNIRK